MNASRILYHITSRGNKPNIELKGLLPSIDDVLENGILGVNLTTGATHYREPLESDVICLIDILFLDISKLWQVDDWWWRYNDVISPSAILFQTLTLPPSGLYENK